MDFVRIPGTGGSPGEPRFSEKIRTKTAAGRHSFFRGSRRRSGGAASPVRPEDSMRLTLRTLLAWLDGVLASDDHQTLGTKVAASEVATGLVDRIHEAVRRDVVLAPAVDGRGLADDPNTAAEFLDNVLDAERLQAFERICLESDMHLAETASCHALLAEATLSPGAVESAGESTRRAMQALVAARLPGGSVTEPPRPRGVRTRGNDAPVAGGARNGAASVPARPASSGAHTSRRRAPLAAWISAAAAVTLVLGLCSVLAWSLARGRSPRRPKPVEVAAASSLPPPAVAPPAVAAQPPLAAVPPATPPPVAAEAIAAAEPAADDGAVAAPQALAAAEAATPPSAPPPAVAEAPAADVRVPNGDALAIVAPPGGAPSVPGITPADGLDAGAAPPAAAPAVAVATIDGGPLIRRSGTEAGSPWVVVGRDLPFEVEGRQDLLVPAFCRATIHVAGIDILLEPATRCSLTRDADGTPRLEVIFGQSRVGGRAADARVGIAAAGLGGVLSGVLEAPAVVDVPLEIEPGGQSRRRARLWVGATEKVWRQTAADGGANVTPLVGVADEALLAPRTTLAWDERDPASAVIEPPAEPAWARASPPLGRVERDAVAALAEALAADPDAGVDEPLHALAAHRRSENRMIAAATLALLGDYDELVAVLCAERPDALGESQWTSLESLTVPLALARGENSAAALAQAFATRGPAGKAETLLRLARGFSADDLASGGDAFLVESLADGSLAVRRYAIRRLEEIVPADVRRRGGYRADRDGASGAEGIAWWRTQLEQGRIRR